MEEWRTSSPPRKSRWCGHLHVTEHHDKTAPEQHDNQESSVWLRGATDESLLSFCVQFEQENQRLVSEMNSLVDEVRSVTSCTATVSFGFDLCQLAARIHHSTDVKQRELVNGLQSEKKQVLIVI